MNVVVDSSVFVTIINNERERDAALVAIMGAALRLTSAVSVLETRIVANTRQGNTGVRLFDEFMADHMIRVVPFGEPYLDAASEAHRKFGKGTGQPGMSKLNMGDCCSYALAKVTGYTLLYKGDDFGVTDINMLRVDA